MTKEKQYIPELITQYNKKVKPYLKEKLGISNEMHVARLSKIVLNMGIGDAKENSNSLKNEVQELSMITGPKPIINYAKNAI